MSDELLKKDMLRKIADDHNEVAKRMTMLLMFNSKLAADIVVTGAAMHLTLVTGSLFAQLTSSDEDIRGLCNDLANDIINCRDRMKAALNDPVEHAKIMDNLRATFGEHYGRTETSG